MQQRVQERDLSTLLEMMSVPHVKRALVHIHGPGGLRVGPAPHAQFHYMVKGSAILQCNEDDTSFELQTGSFVLIRRPQAHSIFNPPAGVLTNTSCLHKSEHADVGTTPVNVRVGRGATETAMIISGTFPHKHLAHHPLYAALPNVVHRPHDWAGRAPLHFSGSEFDGGIQSPNGVGTLEITRRFLDLKLAQIAYENALNTNLLSTGIQRSPSLTQIAAARRLIEREPERQWSVAGLAREVGMSRSAFSAAFSRGVGRTPMGYLNDIRMGRAAELLRKSSLSLLAISQLVGFHSEAAFSRAFKRFTDVSPRSYRTIEGASPPTELAISPWDPFLQ